MALDAILGAAGNIIGGIAGGIASKKDREMQIGAMEQALNELRAVGTPPDLAREIIYQQFQQAGVLTPELEQDLDLAASKMAELEVPEEGRQAQLEALNMMQQLSKGGLQAQDRAALNQVRQEVQRDAEAKRQQILQQMQARGMADSGAALAAQLQAGQGAAEQQSQESDRLAAMANQRALEALGQAGSMGANLRQADTSLASARAQAIDDRNRFLYENSAARQQRNIAAKNQAQAANLQNLQDIRNMNVNLANQEQLRQRNAEADVFNMKMNKAQALAGAEAAKSGVHTNVAGQKAAQYSNMFGGAGQTLGGMADAGNQGQSVGGTFTGLKKFFGGG